MHRRVQLHKFSQTELIRVTNTHIIKKSPASFVFTPPPSAATTLTSLWVSPRTLYDRLFLQWMLRLFLCVPPSGISQYSLVVSTIYSFTHFFFSNYYYKLLEASVFMLLAAAAAAKSLQSCPTLCDPIDSSPPGSPIPGILQARTLEWVAIYASWHAPWYIWKWKWKSLKSCLTLCDPMNDTVHGILQARILEWVAVPSSQGLNPGLPHCRQILYQLSHKGSLFWCGAITPQSMYLTVIVCTSDTVSSTLSNLI